MQCNTRVRTALIGFVVVPVFACGQGKNERARQERRAAVEHATLRCAGHLVRCTASER